MWGAVSKALQKCRKTTAGLEEGVPLACLYILSTLLLLWLGQILGGSHEKAEVQTI